MTYHPTPRYLSREMKTSPHKKLCKCLYQLFFQNCTKLEVIQIPFYWGMDKLCYIYTRNLLSNRRSNLLVNSNHLDESQMHYAKWEEQDSKGYIVYNLIYMAF